MIKIINRQVPIFSLVIYRIIFGLFMATSMIRFILKGWITPFYSEPIFHFTFEWFSWIQPLSTVGMTVLFITLAALCLCISLGLFYRISITLFFLGFTYVELIDKTYYLNHYYAISLLSFLMIFIPLNDCFSLDNLRKKQIDNLSTPVLYLWVIRGMLGCVYFFAGIAKINSDWLLEAQPLKIWLLANSHFPILGSLFTTTWFPYAMSWTGALFDLTIPFLLLNRKTRPFAYFLVLIFHIMTHLLFSIGVFPWLMILLTPIFFEPNWPKKLLEKIKKRPFTVSRFSSTRNITKPTLTLFCTFFIIQLTLPFRYLLHPGHLFWTEKGFRFSWRVMLMEKNGYIEFQIYSPSLNKKWTVIPTEYLTPLQSKMMSTQPDMIYQFANFLGNQFENEADDIEVTVPISYVSLNGRRSSQFIDPSKNLLAETEFILPFPE